MAEDGGVVCTAIEQESMSLLEFPVPHHWQKGRILTRERFTSALNP